MPRARTLRMSERSIAPPPVLLPPPVLPVLQPPVLPPPVLPPPVLPPPQPKLPKDLLVPDWCGDCDWMCSICLEDNPELSRVKTSCGHEFHKACLDGLKKTQENAFFTTYIHSGPWEEGLPVRMDFDTAAAAQSREWHHEPHPVIADGYVLANRTWNVPCPLCRTKIALDDGESKREFDAWSTCRCCDRHLTRRPPSYAPWRMPHERAPRRPIDECECECVCRSRSRELAFQLW